MKFSRILVLMMVGLLLILPGLAEEDAGNLLYNGGFEWTDEDGLPDGWYTDAYVHQEGYTTYRLSDDARSGAACAVVDNLGMNDARFAQSVAVEPESLPRWPREETELREPELSSPRPSGSKPTVKPRAIVVRLGQCPTDPDRVCLPSEGWLLVFQAP